MNYTLSLLFIILSIFACSTKPKDRVPAQDVSNTSLPNRDGNAVKIPGLLTTFNIPSCKSLTEDQKNNECTAEGEKELFESITETAFQFQGVQNPKGINPSQRDFHAKQHACLAGKWTPLKNIPTELAIGAFAIKEPVRAIIRYSNGSPKSPSGNGLVPPDASKDPRGLAIKLVGVPGHSILDIEEKQKGVMNQDFIFINHPAFFLRTPQSYPAFLGALRDGKPFFNSLDDLEKTVLIQSQREISDIVPEIFFSQTPYVLGSSYAKYRIRLCNPEKSLPLSENDKSNPDFLREKIRLRLAKNSICLRFAVQIKKAEMPVEDAAVTWNEENSPFIDVAEIIIPKNQDLKKGGERDLYCENISFNPWNSLEFNRPAGGINRARLGPYTGVSRKRRMENKVRIREPLKTDEFLSILKTQGLF